MPSNLRHPLAALGLLCATPLLPAAAGAQSLRPGGLLVYYGHASAINAASSVPAAAAEFGAYDYVVWGQGLENPAHPDHANAVAIIAHEATVTTRIFGYVDLGVTTQNLPMAEIQVRVTRWGQMGSRRRAVRQLRLRLQHQSGSPERRRRPRTRARSRRDRQRLSSRRCVRQPSRSGPQPVRSRHAHRRVGTSTCTRATA